MTVAMQNLNLDPAEMDSLELLNEQSWHWLDAFYENNIDSELEAFLEHGHSPYQRLSRDLNEITESTG